MGLILLVVATLLSMVFMPIGFVYAQIVFIFRNTPKKWWARWNQYLYTLALGLDQLGNVMMQELFNDFLLLPGAYRFGHEDQTLSHVFGVNKRSGHLNWLGKFVARVLDTIDPNHTDKAADAVGNKK